jgi:hypothetical protein
VLAYSYCGTYLGNYFAKQVLALHKRTTAAELPEKPLSSENLLNFMAFWKGFW